MVTHNLRIYGRVQGVSYRDWTVKQAHKLGVSGWVRNRSDGSVEALIGGDEKDVQHFIATCHKGPMLAKVTRIDITEAEESECPSPFVRKETV